MDKTKVDLAATSLSSSFDGDFPTSRSKRLHKAEKDNMILVHVLRSLATVGTLVLGD
jgi:hypothetical protein